MFPPSKILGEMAPKGVLRQAIRDLATTSGSYVIAATRDDTSESALDLRLDAMRDSLTASAIGTSAHIDFYDARRIADWVEQHPAIVTWVRHKLGKPLVGWRPYSGWAYQEATADSEYLIDNRIKVFTPSSERGINVSASIDHLRNDLSNGASVRIVGLSGVGKTRLVQALFDPRVKTNETELSADEVLYTDLSDGPTPQPSVMLEALIEDKSQCILVIDNCGADTHRKLTEILNRSDSKIGLVTVEYDVREDLPEATKCYRLEGSSDEIIKQLLQRRYPILSASDSDTITKFSDGNARVAFALAATVTTAGELARLRDFELFKRLFHQKNVENDDLLNCAEAASIMYSFDGEDDSAESELNIISAAVGLPLISVQRNVVELQRRGLVQTRGKWRAILPHAIANRLAAQALEVMPKSRLVSNFVETATDRVERSFSRRLGYLHESAKAVAIVRDWLQPSGRFGDLTVLNDIGHEIFRNIAPVSPKCALAAIARAACTLSFISSENNWRAQYAHTLRSIAFEEDDFDIAVDTLVLFALADPQGGGHESTAEILKSLFFCMLSGTNAPPTQRVKFVRKLIESGDSEREQLGLLLLDAALEAAYFTSVNMFDFGARKRSEGWIPVSDTDIKEWYVPFIRVVLDVGKVTSNLADQCRSILGHRLRELWNYTCLRPEVRVAIEELAPVVNWPQGWFGIRAIIRYDMEQFDESVKTGLRELEALLKPTTLNTMVRALLHTSAPYALEPDDDDDEQGASLTGNRLDKTHLKAEELGCSAANDDVFISELLPQLLNNKSGPAAFNFGVGVGKNISDPHWILELAKHHISEFDTQAVGVIFLRGFFYGWHHVSPATVGIFLDRAVSDDVWCKWIMDLHNSLPMNDEAYARILLSIRAGATPAWQYSYLGMGRKTSSFSVVQVAELLSGIAQLPDGGRVFLDVLWMVVHGASDHDDSYNDELARTSLSILQSVTWKEVLGDRANSSYRIENILEFSLKRACHSEMALEVLNSLVTTVRVAGGDYHFRENLRVAITPFLKHMPLQALEAIYIPNIEGCFRETRQVIGRSHSDRKETSLSVVPTAVLIGWCNASPTDRYIFAAQNCKLFDTQRLEHEQQNNLDDISDSELIISETAISVLVNSHDKKTVVEYYIERFMPSGWSGSLAEILRRRLPLLNALNPRDEDELKLILATARESFERRIKWEEQREDAEERERTGSFE
ncbi:hypothetical protein D3C81_721570 [compost metagenome]